MDLQQTKSIIRAALDTPDRQLDYGRQTAERWLQAQPGHHSISVLLTEALMAAGDVRAAERVVRQVLAADPENALALGLELGLHEQAGDFEAARKTAAALRLVEPNHVALKGKFIQMLVQMPVGPPGENGDRSTLVTRLGELEQDWRAGRIDDAKERANGLLATFPELVKAHLIIADCLMAAGNEGQAVAHIHQAASLDPGGEVAQRLWDGSQPYVSAWPRAQVPGVAGPLPHPIAAALGLNLLSTPGTADLPNAAPRNGRNTTPTAAPELAQESPAPPGGISPLQETLINIQTEINRLSGRSEPKMKRDKTQWIRLKPVYAMITSKRRLQAKYGPDGFQQIDGALQALAKAAEARLRLPAGVLYVDDVDSLATFQLSPVEPSDPWAVKELIRQLDRRLGEKEQEVGWLLLVGGPDVIATHRLPNPTDDGDPDVPSDNPYGCRDENYYIPERAVGRLPDGADGSPKLLLQNIATALAAHHAERRAHKGWLSSWWEWLVWMVRGQRAASDSSFGYTASVWRKASLAVFGKIGPARKLRVSPPMTAAEFSSLSMGPSRYGYFNLHGVPDGPAWYGQRDPTFPADYPAFPVALRPEDVGALGCVPEVVFSEACYGASIDERTAQDALCLKFLISGNQMFVGSTCIAYGGLNSTPEAADLLALYFWQEVMAGRSGGVALQQAKVAFAQHLNTRQGYLDGEEQKTLISFCMYGDPTLTAPPASRFVLKSLGAKKSWKELATYPPTACAKRGDCQPAGAVPDELVKQVRARVADYLPGMESAKLTVTRQRVCQRQGSACAGNGGCQVSSKKGPSGKGDKMVFTLHKAAKGNGETHQQVVKVTVDGGGQMLKLMVSK